MKIQLLLGVKVHPLTCFTRCKHDSYTNVELKLNLMKEE